MQVCSSPTRFSSVGVGRSDGLIPFQGPTSTQQTTANSRCKAQDCRFATNECGKIQNQTHFAGFVQFDTFTSPTGSHSTRNVRAKTARPYQKLPVIWKNGPTDKQSRRTIEARSPHPKTKWLKKERRLHYAGLDQLDTQILQGARTHDHSPTLTTTPQGSPIVECIVSSQTLHLPRAIAWHTAPQYQEIVHIFQTFT
jgi:hypothetical protein